MRVRLLVSLLVVGSVAGCTSSNGGGAGAGSDASEHDGAMSTDDASMYDAGQDATTAVDAGEQQDAATAVDASEQQDAATPDADVSDAMVDDASDIDASDAMVDDASDVDASDATVEDASDIDASDAMVDDASDIDASDGAIDINECDNDNGGCDPLTICTNTEGSRTCGPCPGGHSGDGETGCIAATGASCLSILANDSEAISGVYLIDPSGANAFPVYCDMTSDGGGWTKILQYHDVAYTPTADAVGDITTAGTPAFAKLSDAQINAFGSMPTYRISGTRTTKSVYITTDAPFSDPSVGFGLMTAAPTRVCESESFDTCTFSSTSLNYLDTLHWGLVGNDAERYFADYPGNEVNCFTPGATQVRCITAGNSINHAFIDDISIWVRESGLVAHWMLDEGSGTTANDSSGYGHTMTIHSGTWTDGTLNGGFSGVAYTDAPLPDLDSVSVSLWARRAGDVNHFPRIFGWYEDRFEIADYAGTGTLWLYTPDIYWQNTGAALPNDIYVHIAVTIGDGEARVYVDGGLVANYASTISLNGPFYLGTRGSPLGSEAFNGSTDQIRIYDRVLTASEVAALAAE